MAHLYTVGKTTINHSIEEEVLKKREEVFLEVMTEVFKKVEEASIERAKTCQKCLGTLVKNGRDSRVLKTLLGTLEVVRGRFRCLRCGEEIYPFDEAIG